MSVREGCGQRRIFVTPDVIEAWLVHGNAVKTDLPDDARFVRLWQHDVQHAYVLVFESSEWDEIAEGQEIPRMELDVEKLNVVEATSFSSEKREADRLDEMINGMAR